MCWWRWGPAAIWALTVYQLQNAEFSPWLGKVVLELCVHGKKMHLFHRSPYKLEPSPDEKS